MLMKALKNVHKSKNVHKCLKINYNFTLFTVKTLLLRSTVPSVVNVSISFGNDIIVLNDKLASMKYELAVGQRTYNMVRCPSVGALTFSLNIFFSETNYRILMKFHRNVPVIVLFRIS